MNGLPSQQGVVNVTNQPSWSDHTQVYSSTTRSWFDHSAKSIQSLSTEVTVLCNDTPLICKQSYIIIQHKLYVGCMIKVGQQIVFKWEMATIQINVSCGYLWMSKKKYIPCLSQGWRGQINYRLW